MIKDLIPSGAVSKETRLVLANALYFKGSLLFVENNLFFIGKWRDEFKPENTKPGDFSLLNGGKSETNL